MSDESFKKPAKPAADLAGSGAAPRPEGKRQVAGTASSARAQGASAARSPEVVKTRKNPFAAVVDYIRGVISEISKVIWPTGRELFTYTLIVLAFLIIMIVLVAGVDYLTSMGVRAVFGV